MTDIHDINIDYKILNLLYSDISYDTVTEPMNYDAVINSMIQ